MTGKLYKNAPPFIPFNLPIPMPDEDPDTSPGVSVCFSEKWLPAVLTAIKSLVDVAAWKADDQTSLDLTMKRAMLLLSMFIEAGPCETVPSEGCFEGDFTALTYDFGPVGTGCAPSWSQGSGWLSCQDSPTDPPTIKIGRMLAPIGTYITSFKLSGTAAPLAVTTDLAVTFKSGGVQTGQYTGVKNGPGDFSFEGVAGVQADEVEFWAVESAGIAGGFYLTGFELCYVGAFPLSTAPDTFEHVFDFTIDDGGWTVVNAGAYSAGVGWVNSFFTFSGTCYDGVHIHRSHNPATLTSVEMVYTKTPGTYDDPGVRDTLVGYPGGTGTLLSGSSSAAGKAPNWAGIATASTGVEFSSTCDVHIGGACYGDGNVVLSRMIVRGIGTDPF